MTVRILVVDDEPDVEMLFRQQFRREIRDGLCRLDFALSAPAALAKPDFVLHPTSVTHDGNGSQMRISDAHATKAQIPPPRVSVRRQHRPGQLSGCMSGDMVTAPSPPVCAVLPIGTC